MVLSSVRKLLLVKPQTYMNLSGESVREIVSYYDIDLEDLIVIYDDFDLEIETIRIEKRKRRQSQRDEVHYRQIQSKDFPRIRIESVKAVEVLNGRILFLVNLKKQDEKLIGLWSEQQMQ